MPTKIEWVRNPDGTRGESWNPIRGAKGMWHCTKASPGCKNCYSERMNMSARYGKGPAYKAGADTFRLDGPALAKPLHWRKPRGIFVCSMTDLFHEDVEFEWIRMIWDVVSACLRHTFMILTKRPHRLLEFTQWMAGADDISAAHWPRNAWVGVSAENQEMADKRISVLLQIPAAIRFVSYEPALGPVNLRRYMPGYVDADGLNLGLDWVIAGAESGPKRRPADIQWFSDLNQQCVVTGTPFFLKQMERDGKVVKMPVLGGVVWDHMPAAEKIIEEEAT